MKPQIILFSVLSFFFSAPLFAANMNCVGTEPFWGVKVTGSTLTYSNPENPDGFPYPIASVREAQGYTSGTATVIKTGCSKWKTTTLTMVRGECSDGMSDTVYTHHAVYDVDGIVLYGCCK